MVDVDDKCSWCFVGVVRPTGRTWQVIHPSGKAQGSRRLKCDNDDCGRGFITLKVIAPIGTVVDVEVENE